MCLSSAEAICPVGATKRAWACSTGFNGVGGAFVSKTLLVPLSFAVRVDEKATPPFLAPPGLTCLKATLPSLVSVSTS